MRGMSPTDVFLIVTECFLLVGLDFKNSVGVRGEKNYRSGNLENSFIQHDSLISTIRDEALNLVESFCTKRDRKRKTNSFLLILLEMNTKQTNFVVGRS